MMTGGIVMGSIVMMGSVMMTDSISSMVMMTSGISGDELAHALTLYMSFFAFFSLPY